MNATQKNDTMKEKKAWIERLNLSKLNRKKRNIFVEPDILRTFVSNKLMIPLSIN